MNRHALATACGAVALTGLVAVPLAAKDSLGVFGEWAAFRDAKAPRCYAIAMPAPSRLQRDFEPYATIATWPTRKIRSQVHFRLSRTVRSGAAITLAIGRESFTLTGGGGDAWAANRNMDAAIVTAMRSANRMIVRATDAKGRRFSNTYALDGAATAMDAATVGCARR